MTTPKARIAVLNLRVSAVETVAIDMQEEA